MIEQLKCYKSVANVIGEEAAKEALSLVWNTKTFSDHEDISYAFTWDETPQGHQFWEDIWSYYES